VRVHVDAEGAVEEVVVAGVEAFGGEVAEVVYGGLEGGAFLFADEAPGGQVAEGEADPGEAGGVGRPVESPVDEVEAAAEGEEGLVLVPVGVAGAAVMVEEQGLARQSGEQSGLRLVLGSKINCLTHSG